MIAQTWGEAGIDILQIPAHATKGRLQCPQCSHTRKKHKDKCLSVDLFDALWYCHHCGYSGAIRNETRGEDWNENGWKSAHDAWIDEVKRELERNGVSNTAEPEYEPGENRGTAVMSAAMTMANLQTLELPPQDFLLYPWLERPSLCMVYAWRGVGKSLFIHEVMASVASGEGFLGWPAADPARLDDDGMPLEGKPRKVLLIDGELTTAKLQARAKMLFEGRNGRKVAPENILIIGRDQMVSAGETHVNIASIRDQDAIGYVIDQWQPDLVICDNLSTLARSEYSENEGESWTLVSDWLFNLRAKGISVLIVHHSGKGGDQRGTSQREDAMDTVIRLVQDEEFEPAEGMEGASFTLKWVKTRDFNGRDMLLRCNIERAEEGKRISGWDFSDVRESQEDVIREMVADGAPGKAICAELEISRKTLQRRMKALGLTLRKG